MSTRRSSKLVSTLLQLGRPSNCSSWTASAALCGASTSGREQVSSWHLVHTASRHTWSMQDGLSLTSLGRPAPTAFSGQQLRSMFIQTQTTPNPASLMFLPGKSVMQSGSAEFSNARTAMSSPLANRLFKIDGVTAVFFGSDFITVTKKEEVPWAVLKPDIFAAVMDHYSSGDALLLDSEALARSDTAIHEDDDEIVSMIKELLETRIRPAVQEDGGDIVYKGFDHDTGIVSVKMQGACSGCPSSAITLKSGIDSMLKHYVPEVKGVVEAPPDEEELNMLSESEKEMAKLEAQLSH